MKILYFTQTGQLLTGSGTYRDVLLNEMNKRHIIKVLSDSRDYEKDWDIAHILDLKHANLKYLQKLNCPVVVDIHDYYWTQFYSFPCPDLPLRYILQKVRRWKYSKILKKAQAIIVHSEYMRGKIHHPNTFVIRLAIDPNGYNYISDQRGKDLILFVGRDYFRKGLFTLIKALPLVLKEIPSAKVLVIGPEYLHSRLVARSLSRNLPIEFINGLSPRDIKEYFYRANVFVLPSEIEASGIVLLEAMAAGLPVVATNVGGIPEVIKHGVNGLLVERGDSEQLAAGIVKCLRDDKMERFNDLKNHPIWGDMFNPTKMVKSIESAYQQITGNIIKITAS
jgi:glycosyltransferase involved in cell wall biosynthesis